MKHPRTWDETMPFCTGKMLDTSFLYNLAAEEWCDATYMDGWSRVLMCERPVGHGGRHMTMERLCRYPIAVWE